MRLGDPNSAGRSSEEFRFGIVSAFRDPSRGRVGIAGKGLGNGCAFLGDGRSHGQELSPSVFSGEPPFRRTRARLEIRIFKGCKGSELWRHLAASHFRCDISETARPGGPPLFTNIPQDTPSRFAAGFRDRQEERVGISRRGWPIRLAAELRPPRSYGFETRFVLSVETSSMHRGKALRRPCLSGAANSEKPRKTDGKARKG